MHVGHHITTCYFYYIASRKYSVEDAFLSHHALANVSYFCGLSHVTSSLQKHEYMTLCTLSYSMVH